MRRMLLSYLAGLALLLSASAGAADTANTTLTIKGMTCGGCVAAVKLQLRRTDGVTAYEVSLEKAEAEVTYDPKKTEPKKIAESVSTTGFQATVKGQEKKGAGSTDGSIRPLESRELREWFNASSGSVRVISLLSPTCSYCQAGHGVLKTVFARTASSDLKAFLVWLPMLTGDDAEAALRQAATFTDPRLTEGWDGGRAIGDLFARRLALRGTAWDVYLLYDRGVRWEETEPPAPSFWMHQLKASVGADQELCLDPSRFSKEVLARLERKG
jgi:copper chaperone CopZ